MLTTSFKQSALFVGALLLSSSAAWAVAGDAAVSKILDTSGLYADAGKTYHACVVSNVTTANATVKVDLLDVSGNTITSSGTTPETIAPGATVELALGGSESYTGFARCRILVYSGNADAIRANESVFVQTGTYFATIAFSEAR